MDCGVFLSGLLLLLPVRCDWEPVSGTEVSLKRFSVDCD